MTSSESQYRAERRFARRCVVQFLYQADQQADWGNVERSLNLLKQRLSVLTDVPASARAFERGWEYACVVARGICSARSELDARIGECATNWTVDRMSFIDRNILRLAAYELIHSAGDVPDATVIDEAVELAKEFGHKDSPRFVNGVLDHLLRECREKGVEDQ